MFRTTRVFVLALAGGMMWSCAGDRVTMSQAPGENAQGVRPLGKAAVTRDLTQVVVAVEVRQDGSPVSGATVELSRSIAARPPNYRWSGVTDEDGRARVYIWADDVGGYYRARVSQDGIPMGSWSSIPINGGYELTIDLPVGGKARVTGSSILTQSPVGSWAYAGTDMVQTIRDNVESFLLDQGLDPATAAFIAQEFVGDMEDTPGDVWSPLRHFNADGSFEDEDSGNTGTWSVSGHLLTLVNADGLTLEGAYFVDGDALTLFLTRDQFFRIIEQTFVEPPDEEEQMLFNVMLREGDIVRFFFEAG